MRAGAEGGRKVCLTRIANWAKGNTVVACSVSLESQRREGWQALACGLAALGDVGVRTQRLRALTGLWSRRDQPRASCIRFKYRQEYVKLKQICGTQRLEADAAWNVGC